MIKINASIEAGAVGDNAAVPVLAPLLSRFADDPEMREIVALFVAEVPDRLRELQTAWDAADLGRMRTLAHQIKGAAGGYGFPEISTAAAALEAAVSAGARSAGAKGPGGGTAALHHDAAKTAFGSLMVLLTRVVMAG